MSKILKGRKGQEESEAGDKLKQIDKELLSFYDYCNQMGFSEDEIEKICSPLNGIMRKNNLREILKSILLILGLIGIIYLAAQIEFLQIHGSALGRIAMIKMIPLWDWRHLSYSDCIVKNPYFGEYTLTEEDCMYCENKEVIDIVSKISYDMVTNNYINMDSPVIVTDAMTDWPSAKSPNFGFDNITEAFLDDDTVPCDISSNIRTTPPMLSSYMKKMRKIQVDKWFIHWRNCDLNAVKVLRSFYHRPYFLANTVPPAHFNWVLMSSGYFSTNYKRIELDSGLIMLSQLRGETSFRLVPLTPCNATCPELYGSVQEGEILLFHNYLWSFEYNPGSKTNNIAILTETTWDESDN